MGKASRLKRKRQSVRREVKSDLIARVESHTAVGHLPWGQAPGGPKISDALAELNCLGTAEMIAVDSP